MNKMTWLDLYTFLHNKANNINGVGTFDWNTPVSVYDGATGDEFDCDTYYLTDKDKERLVLMFNIEKGTSA